MSDLTLTKTRITGGVWNGILTGAAGDTSPRLVLTHRGEVVPGLKTTRIDDGTWSVDVPIPADHLADGVQTFIITDSETEAKLTSFAFLAGEALSEDIRAEMDLLREELDMLKRAFRRHCLETAVEE